MVKCGLMVKLKNASFLKCVNNKGENQMNVRKFEKVSKYDEVIMPKRSTKFSAGYDICSSEDIIIPSIWRVVRDDLSSLPYEERKEAVKELAKPTLVPTGIKVQMPRDNVLFLYNRSSNPVKRGLVLANSVGVIDSDYYNNPDNEGAIFGSFYNFGAADYKIKKGDKIMQGIFGEYLLTADDDAEGKREGGFGSTGK